MSKEGDGGSESRPRYLSPSAIGEYISQSKCDRYAKHVFQDIDRSVHYDSNEFKEAFNPLNILVVSQSGLEFSSNWLP